MWRLNSGFFLRQSCSKVLHLGGENDLPAGVRREEPEALPPPLGVRLGAPHLQAAQSQQAPSHCLRPPPSARQLVLAAPVSARMRPTTAGVTQHLLAAKAGGRPPTVVLAASSATGRSTADDCGGRRIFRLRGALDVALELAGGEHGCGGVLGGVELLAAGGVVHL